MPRLLCRLAFALVVLCAAAAPAPAQQILRAAAVVNDEVISVLDLEMRLRLVMMSSGMQDDAEARRRLTPQVLRTLIDERLQLQEAERLGVEVADEAVQQALGRIAQSNDMKARQFIGVLESNGIMVQTLTNQVRARLAWEQVVAQRLRSEVDIGEEEVDDVVERIESAEGKRQMKVSEIFLAVDDPGQEEEVRATARRLVQQLRNGADFTALAQQFSQAATAAVGGDLGWVQPGRLADELNARLKDMQPGELAGPIRTYSGFHIMKLQDRRTVTVGDQTLRLSQIYLPVASDASDEAVGRARAEARRAAAGLEGCQALESAAENHGAATSGSLGEVKLSNLPGHIRQAVADLEVGRPSPPVRVDAGVVVLMVCERQTSGIDREQIRRGIIRERMNMLARRYLRDLRREAHVDIRL